MGELLFLAHRVPYPPDRGDRMRSWHLLRGLAERGPLHLASFAESKTEREAAAPILPMLASHHIEVRRVPMIVAGLRALASGHPVSLAAFASRTMASHVEALLAHRPITDIVVFSGQMAQYVPDGRRFLMDFVDVDSAKFETFGSASRGPMAWINRREGRLLAAYEAAVARRADRSLFVSDAEAALFRVRSGLGADRVSTLANGIDLDRYDPAAVTPVATGPKGALIVFTGQMDYQPNIEAVMLFARQTMPLIRTAKPDARFVIVGRDPTTAVKALAALPGVTVTGAVDDVRGWIAAAAVVVAPLRLARGVQNKLLEAMALARPVVASSAAAEGIDAVVGEELVVADGAKAEAAAVLALIDDPARARAMGESARRRMVSSYGWDRPLARLAVLLERERVSA
jgi:sugar transferase (PEP-CTERM/EpsH1 system associated)